MSVGFCVKSSPLLWSRTRIARIALCLLIHQRGLLRLIVKGERERVRKTVVEQCQSSCYCPRHRSPQTSSLLQSSYVLMQVHQSDHLNSEQASNQTDRQGEMRLFKSNSTYYLRRSSCSWDGFARTGRPRVALSSQSWGEEEEVERRQPVEEEEVRIQVESDPLLSVSQSVV